MAKVAVSMGWLWRRIADLGTVAWLWPGGVALVTGLIANAQQMPWAIQLLLVVAAFVLTLIGVLVWQVLAERVAGRVIHIRPSPRRWPKQMPPGEEVVVLQIIMTGDGKIIYAVRTYVDEIGWDPRDSQPLCQLLQVTNHSEETLADVSIVVEARASKANTNEPAGSLDITVQIDKIRPGDDHAVRAYIVNDSAYFVALTVKDAAAAKIGGEPTPIRVHVPRSMTSAMLLYPSPRFESKNDQTAAK